MVTPRPAPLNVLADDLTGNTWGLPEGAIARFGKGARRTSPDFGSIALTPDGAYFAIGTGMGLWWYDVSTMSPVSLWETERGLISSVDISSDGKLVATGNWDGIVKILDIQNGKCVAQMERYKLYSFINFLTFSPDNQWVAAATRKQGVEVLDVHRGKCIAQMKLDSSEGEFNIIAGVEFSPDGQYLAVTETATHSENGGYTPLRDGSQTAVWDPRTGDLIARFPCSKFAFSADSKLLACACPDNTGNGVEDTHHRFISVWDITTGERIAYFKGHEHWINAVSFSPCGQLITSADRGGNLRVWELVTGTQRDDWSHSGIDAEQWDMNHWDTKWYLSEFKLTRITPSYLTGGKLFVVVFPDETDTAELWDVERREKLQSIERLPGTNGSIYLEKCPELVVAWTLSNISAMSDNSKSWATLREYTFLHQSRMGKGQNLDSLWFTADGQNVVCNSDGGGVVLWGIRPKHKTFLKRAYSRILRAMFTQSVRQQVFETLLTEQRTEKERAQETLKKDSTFSSVDWHTIAVSPCSKIIAVGAYGEILLWCSERLTTLYSIPYSERKQQRYVLSFSSCGKYLASGTWWQRGMEKMSIRLWDVATGENIHTFKGHSTDIQTLTFSPDGTLFASGSYDGTILLWDLKPLIGM
ncbi:hypothetical protein JT359_19620 [Candidatus Poribacteria bacterium]|nr:hypothetical protein [Candidatus Poribacteria bacterium]